MAREPSLPPEVEEDPQLAAARLWKEVCILSSYAYMHQIDLLMYVNMCVMWLSCNCNPSGS